MGLHFKKDSAYDFARFGKLDRASFDKFRQGRDATAFLRLVQVSSDSDVPLLDALLFDLLTKGLKLSRASDIASDLKGVTHRDAVLRFRQDRLNPYQRLEEDLSRKGWKDSILDVDRFGSPVLMERTTKCQMAWSSVVILDHDFDLAKVFENCPDRMEWPQFLYIVRRFRSFVRLG